MRLEKEKQEQEESKRRQEEEEREVERLRLEKEKEKEKQEQDEASRLGEEVKRKKKESEILGVEGEADTEAEIEGEEDTQKCNNLVSSSSLPQDGSQREESSSLSVHMGCSMACDMLLTASTAIASPGAAILLRSNFEGESNAAVNLNDEAKAEQQTTATSSRRTTGRKSKRNYSQEADSQNVPPVAGAKDHDLSTDMIAEAETEADNTDHRGKRSRTVKTEAIIPSSARGVKRSAGSAQSSQVNNESEVQDQHPVTGRAAGPLGGKKAALEGTEKLSTPCESQPHTGNRIDHDEKEDKMQKDNEYPVRIINTGLLYGDEEFEELARACGAVVAALPSNATHIVTTDTLKRTPKVQKGDVQ